jgi:uncharacterized protein
MERDRVIARLRDHERELRHAGAASLSLFGSMARGDDVGSSDVDIVVRLADDVMAGGLVYFRRMDDLRRRLETILGRPVDLISEPVRKERLPEESSRIAELPSSRPRDRLTDIAENIEAILGYTAGMSEADYLGDRLRQDAVERGLQRISEAALKLGSLAEELVSGHDWAGIRGIGNVLRHAYDAVDPSIIGLSSRTTLRRCLRA